MNARWNEALEALRLQLEHDPEGHSLRIGFKKIHMAHIKGLHTLHKPAGPHVEADLKGPGRIKGLMNLQRSEVSYMETQDGKFSCAHCRSLNKDGFSCDNPRVEAVVSKDRGCCNLFFPAEGKPLSSKHWKTNEEK